MILSVLLTLLLFILFHIVILRMGKLLRNRRLPFLRGGYMISLAHFFVYIVIDSGIVSSRYCLMLYDSLPSFSFKWSFSSWIPYLFNLAINAL